MTICMKYIFTSKREKSVSIILQNSGMLDQCVQRSKMQNFLNSTINFFGEHGWIFHCENLKFLLLRISLKQCNFFRTFLVELHTKNSRANGVEVHISWVSKPSFACILVQCFHHRGTLKSQFIYPHLFGLKAKYIFYLCFK